MIWKVFSGLMSKKKKQNAGTEGEADWLTSPWLRVSKGGAVPALPCADTGVPYVPLPRAQPHMTARAGGIPSSGSTWAHCQPQH